MGVNVKWVWSWVGVVSGGWEDWEGERGTSGLSTLSPRALLADRALCLLSCRFLTLSNRRWNASSELCSVNIQSWSSYLGREKGREGGREKVMKVLPVYDQTINNNY